MVPEKARTAGSAAGRAVAVLLRGLIRVYSGAISTFLPRSCRFYPSCSAYAAQALTEHGALRGSILAVRRIARCHPFHKGSAHDPVPPAGTDS